LGAITGPQQWTDLTLHDSEDVDVFAFQILPEGDAYHFEVSFRNFVTDVELSLYAEDGSWIRDAWSWSTNIARIPLQGLDPGSYYLK
jgi:hypothetical protein